MNTPTIPEAPQATKHVTITLVHPIVRGEQRSASISLREPRAGELRGVALYDLLRLDVAELHTVLPRITSPTLTSADVSALSLPDLMEIAGKVSGFFVATEVGRSSSHDVSKTPSPTSH